MRVKNAVRQAPTVSDVTVGIGPSILRNIRHNGCRLDDFDDFFEDDAPVVSFRAAEGSGHIFVNCKTGVFSICCFPHFLNNSHGLHKQATSCGFFIAQTFVAKSCTSTGHAEILARRSETDDVNRLNLVALDLGHAPKMLHFRKTASCHGDGIRLNLCCPDRLDATQGRCKRETARAIK